MTITKCKTCGLRSADEFCDEKCGALYADADHVIQTGRTLKGMLRKGWQGTLRRATTAQELSPYQDSESQSGEPINLNLLSALKS